MNLAMRRLLARLQAPEGGGEGGGGGGGGGGNPPPAPKTPETFSREYVHELREENKAIRLRAQTAEAKVAEYETKLKDAEKATQDAVKAAEKAGNEKLVRAEVKAMAVKEGIVDIDGLNLADLSKVKFNDKGELEGGQEAIDALKASKPYLFTQPSTSSTTQPPKPGDSTAKKATEMDAKEYEAARQALLNK